MENNGQKKKWYGNVNVWLPNLYYIGTLVSIAFILAQVLYAKRSIVESGEWEKAKMTIENIERFKLELSKSPLAGTDAWMFADNLWPDFSTPEGWNSPSADTLLSVYISYFDDKTKVKEEVERMIDMIDAFAYPIIMGYASEIGSFENVKRQFSTYGAYVMPLLFREYLNIGSHAKLLYRLWRTRHEQMVVRKFHLYDLSEENIGLVKDILTHIPYFKENKITAASLKKYDKELNKKLKKIQKEIEVFRKVNSK